ncbi:hypothetical protein COOONC_10742, partial [Cooperia oncophora]
LEGGRFFNADQICSKDRPVFSHELDLACPKGKSTTLIITNLQAHRAVEEAPRCNGGVPIPETDRMYHPPALLCFLRMFHYVTSGNRDTVNDRVPSPRYTYNSTQSLYDPQQPEGYLGYRSNFSNRGRGGSKADIGRAPSPVRFKRTSQIQKNERSSMRAEGGQRRNVGNRRRNDSINSTQSECLPTSVGYRSFCLICGVAHHQKVQLS